MQTLELDGTPETWRGREAEGRDMEHYLVMLGNGSMAPGGDWEVTEGPWRSAARAALVLIYRTRAEAQEPLSYLCKRHFRINGFVL